MASLDLNVDLGPIRLRSPLIAASGTVGSVWEWADVADVASYGAAVAKSVSPVPWPGSRRPSPRSWRGGDAERDRDPEPGHRALGRGHDADHGEPGGAGLGLGGGLHSGGLRVGRQRSGDGRGRGGRGQPVVPQSRRRADVRPRRRAGWRGRSRGQLRRRRRRWRQALSQCRPHRRRCHSLCHSRRRLPHADQHRSWVRRLGR